MNVTLPHLRRNPSGHISHAYSRDTTTAWCKNLTRENIWWNWQIFDLSKFSTIYNYWGASHSSYLLPYSYNVDRTGVHLDVSSENATHQSCTTFLTNTKGNCSCSVATCIKYKPFNCVWDFKLNLYIMIKIMIVGFRSYTKTYTEHLEILEIRISWIIELRISKYLSLCVDGHFYKIQSQIVHVSIIKYGST